VVRRRDDERLAVGLRPAQHHAHRLVEGEHLAHVRSGVVRAGRRADLAPRHEQQEAAPLGREQLQRLAQGQGLGQG